MRLLLLNAFKGLRKKKIQMLGIVLMVTLATGVYVCMNTALDRLEDRYYSYLEEQNVEDISFNVAFDYSKDVSVEDLDYIKNNILTDMSETETEIFNRYYSYIKNNEAFDSDLLTNVVSLFDKYDADEYVDKKYLEEYKNKYDFEYEVDKSKTVVDNNITMKVIPYNSSKKINKIYLIEGNYPTGKNEITVLPKFAKKHNIKIGDDYSINRETYKVVGFAYAPDYIYPLITFSIPVFDESKNDIVYVNEKSYDDIKGIVDNTYSIRYNHEASRKFELILTEETGEDSIFGEDHVQADINTVTRLGRIAALQLEFASDRLFAKYFLYLLLGIAVFIILVITKKRIEDERLQIGVLKSLGYNRFCISLSYLVYPIIGSIIGGVIGWTIGTLLHLPIATVFLSFYNVPLSNFKIDLTYLKTAILTPMISLSILSYLIALFMLRKKPLSLLKEGSNLKVNIFSRLVNKITGLLPFDYRFKYSLAFRSLGKLIIVTLTSFCTGMLLVLILIGANLFSSMIDSSFGGINYKYAVFMNSLSNTEISDKEDAVLNISAYLISVKDKDGNIKEIELESDETISLNGVDKTLKYLDILDENNKSIVSTLKENNMIISVNLAELNHIEIGDTLNFSVNNQEFTYTVNGISGDYMSYTGYALRSDLSSKLGLKTSFYNQKASIDDKYLDLSNLSDTELGTIAYVVNMDELKDNMNLQVERFNGSLYLIIFFAALMAFIIIMVIANIVVEENKKTISLMKVMGYNNRKISNIVLNIYTPFIIIAYLLSIPSMINLLKWIVKQLVGDMGITIPISLSPFMATLGLLGLVLAYTLAMFLSKKVLNKIPLAIALKRE